MHDYDSAIREAKAYLESLKADAQAELDEAMAAAEESAEIEADDEADDDGLNEFGFRPYINAAGEHIAFEAFADDEMDPATRLAAIRGQDGWELWRTDPDGQRWYVKSGVKPPGIIHGNPSSLDADYD